LAKKRTDEDVDLFDFDLDDEEEDYMDDTELNDEFEDESEDADEDDEGTDDGQYDEIRQKVVDEVVEELAKGDTNSPIFKGLQKVISRKDKEILEHKQALIMLGQAIQSGRYQGSEVSQRLEFLEGFLEKMLDDDGKQVYKSERDRKAAELKQKQQEEVINQILKNQTRGQWQPTYEADDQENDEFAGYRREALDRLKEFVKMSGIDPNHKELDYGDEQDSLLERMNALSESIKKVRETADDEEIQSVRRKKKLPSTRTNGERKRGQSYSARDILDEGALQLIKQMRGK